MKYSYLHLIIIFLSLINGCSFSKNIKTVDLNIKGSNYQNLDLHGVASPVLIKIFELKKTEKFNSMSKLAIKTGVENYLKNDLINKEEYLLIPNEKVEFLIKLRSVNNKIGILGEFIEQDRSDWKYLIEPINDNLNLELLVTGNDILRNIKINQ